MAETKNEKAAAERERKARIKRAHAHLEALPADDRQAVLDSAAEKEGDARDAGSRRAHIAFVEDALVAWIVGGRAIDAGTMTPDAIDALVEEVSREVRGDAATEEMRADARHVLAGATATPALAVEEQAAQAVAQERQSLEARAVAMREKGLTVAEIARELKVGTPAARELCGLTARGGAKAKAPKAAGRKRVEREVRGAGADRQEKCPECGEWKPAPQDAAGGYVKAADFREGRGDCRACYNKRWLEGKQRREAARAGK